MSVSFPTASGGATYDPSTYLSSPAAAIADPVDAVNLSSVGAPSPVTAAAATSSTSPSSTSTTTTTSPSTSSGTTAATSSSTASTASALKQEYQNFETDNVQYLLESTFGASTALDQASVAFGSQAAISATTNATLGVLSQAAGLQNPTTLAFDSSSTGSTIDTSA